MNSPTSQAMNMMRPVFLLGAALLFLGGCGGDNNPTSSNPSPNPNPGQAPAPVIGSSAFSSGSTAVFTADGATKALTPAAAGAAAGGTVKLLNFPNTGGAVAAVVSVGQISALPITTSLDKVDGTSVDPAQDLGLAFGYNQSKVSFFRLSTRQEIATFDTQVSGGLSFSGASGVKIAGAIMNPANKTALLATASGFIVVDYTNPNAPTKVRTIPSLEADPTNGVEVMENFAFDPKLAIGGINRSIIITGGNFGGGLFGSPSGGSRPYLVLVDPESGKAYKPDAATAALFSTAKPYIDAAAVDTNYHVAVLAEEFSGAHIFVDLNQLTLNETGGTYGLPAAAVNRIDNPLAIEYTNLAIESTNHLLFMGQGFGGRSMIIGVLKSPSVGLGLLKETGVFPMPTANDNNGNSVSWVGGRDPHGAGAYITPSDHPTQPNRSLALWASGAGTHIAIIDLQGVLDGVTTGGASYNPVTTTPKDIAYFEIP